MDWVKFILNPSPVLGIQNFDQQKFILYAAILCDTIWKKRNELVHSANPEGLTDPRQIADQIQKSYLDHCQAWDFKIFDRGRLLGWTPPSPPHIKLNFDAAIGEGVVGLAMVCRDHMAKILFIWTDLIQLDDPLMAEANAAFLAAKKATEIGFQLVIVEGDSLKVIQAIQGITEAYIWSIDNVIFDIRSLLSKLSFWNVSHVFRELNTAAHSVARWGLSCNYSGTISISSIPSFVFMDWTEWASSSAFEGF